MIIVYNSSLQCMPWTWFLSLEMQFFIVASLVLLLAEIHSTYAIIIGVATFIISILASVVWESDPITNAEFSIGYDARQKHNRTKFLITQSSIFFYLCHRTFMQKELAEFNLVFDNICLRMSPYIMGICVGYILQRTQSSLKMNFVVLVCGNYACIL